MTPDDSAAALLRDLSVRIYEPPLSAMREKMRDLPDVLRTVVLAIDFDTELSMQGIFGFLENSTGEFLPETIAAFETIGATTTAHVLTDIRDILIAAGMTTDALRRDLHAAEPWQVTSFRRLHPSADDRLLDAVRERASGLYVYEPNAEKTMRLLEEYVSMHMMELRAELSTWS